MKKQRITFGEILSLEELKDFELELEEAKQQAKSEAIKEFEKMINEICGRCCVNKLQELKQKLKEMK